jgi:nitroimidazol reductase NimA-like FMN-containing flavoprotein (pyridoxamine 5'-phosphate oxidase superfamily)
MSIDTESPEYRAVLVDGLTRFVHADAAEHLARAKAARIVR